MEQRIFAVPDLHGRNDLLQELLETLKSLHCMDLNEDKLIFLGDMIDRGADSKGVIDTIKSLREQYPNNVVALLGNHEKMALDACANPNSHYLEMWLMNGGNKTIESYNLARQKTMFDYEREEALDPYASLSNKRVNPYEGPLMSYDHLEWLSKLPTQHMEPGFFFSHAPVPKDEYRYGNFQGDQFTEHELTWTFMTFVDEEECSREFAGRVGVCGHIHRLREGFQTKPRMYKHYIFADSGCGCSPKAPLTCVEVVSREVVTIWPPEALETLS